MPCVAGRVGVVTSTLKNSAKRRNQLKTRVAIALSVVSILALALAYGQSQARSRDWTYRSSLWWVRRRCRLGSTNFRSQEQRNPTSASQPGHQQSYVRTRHRAACRNEPPREAQSKGGVRYSRGPEIPFGALASRQRRWVPGRHNQGRGKARGFDRELGWSAGSGHCPDEALPMPDTDNRPSHS